MERSRPASSANGEKRPQFDQHPAAESPPSRIEKQPPCLFDAVKSSARDRRQYSIGRYIVAFFCVECDLAIELDGAPHFRELGSKYDAERTAFLREQGIEIIRFENQVVHQNIEAVLETIREAVGNRSA